MNKEKLIELKTNMTELEVKRLELQKKQDEFNEQNKELIENINKIRDSIDNCKEILTENAEEGYKKDGEKKRLGGIGIRISKVLCYDEIIALKWAKEKDLFLQLDKKAFENVAKTGEIDFVEIKEKVKVTFPKEIKLE